MPRLYAAIGLVTMLLTPSCGKGLVNEDYLGKPIFILDGLVSSSADLPTELNESTNIRTSIFWARNPFSIDDWSLAEQTRGITTTLTFPGIFRLRVFHAPISQDSYLEPLFGLVMVYVDSNRNGHFNASTDFVLGDNTERAVVLVSGETKSTSIGFSVVSLPLKSCLPPKDMAPESSGETLEASTSVGGIQPAPPNCSVDGDCGEGLACNQLENACIPRLSFIISARKTETIVDNPFCTRL